MLSVVIQQITVLIDTVSFQIHAVSVSVYQISLLIHATSGYIHQISLEFFPEFCLRHTSVFGFIRGNIQVRKNFRKNTLCDILRIFTVCLIFCIRFIYNHIKKHLWIVHRSKGNKGNQIFTVSSRKFFRGTCLTTGAVALYLGCPAGTFLHTGFHVGTDICGNLRRYSLFHQNRIDLFDRGTIAVTNFCYKMRLIIGTAVDNRTHRIDLLEHRTGKSLSECRTGKLSLSHCFFCMNYTGSFIRKINSRTGSEVK